MNLLRPSSRVSLRARAHRRAGMPSRRCALHLEDLERRLALSAPTAPAGPDGIDSLALADVNADRLVDVVVGGRVAGANEVQILDGRGWPNRTNLSQSTVNILATLGGSDVPSAGNLSVAAGDFAGRGVSDVAVSSDQSRLVSVYQFQVIPNRQPPPPTHVTAPLDAAVSPSRLGDAFTPPDLAGAGGLTLAAADLDGGGVDELVVGSAGAGPNVLDIMKLDRTTQTWQRAGVVDLSAAGISGGVSLSAGDLLGNGKPVIAVASATTGEVGIYDPSSRTWLATIPSPTGQAGGSRVAVVANEGAPGALVVTADSGAGQPVLIPAGTWRPQPFTPGAGFSAGGGALVPLGGGWVYPKSTFVTPKASANSKGFPYSPGPVAPTVLLASTRSDQWLVQGFLAGPNGPSGVRYTPNASPLNTFVEPALSQAVQQVTAFTPLEEAGDLPTSKGGTPGVTPAQAAAVVAYPQIAYHSPYAINLANALPGIADGLLPSRPFRRASSSVWGPGRTVNQVPTPPAGNAAAWLQQRLLTVYSQEIGVAYQHHHTPLWAPAQGSPWNVAAIGYQSRGIDCTNFTAFAYADALGINMSGNTKVQAAIGISSSLAIPAPLAGAVQVQTFAPPPVRDQASYQAFVSSLQPGDILFINGAATAGKAPNPSGCVHAITYLGSYGTRDGRPDPYLIIDSTGNTPPHVDSDGHIIPSGVQVRPFGAPGTANDWYFTHVDHVLRLIVPGPTATPSGSPSGT